MGELFRLSTRDLLIKLGEQVETDRNKQTKPLSVGSILGGKSTALKQPENGKILSALVWLANQRIVLFKHITNGLEPSCRKMIAKGDVDLEVLSKASRTLKVHYSHYDPRHSGSHLFQTWAKGPH